MATDFHSCWLLVWVMRTSANYSGLYVIRHEFSRFDTRNQKLLSMIQTQITKSTNSNRSTANVSSISTVVRSLAFLILAYLLPSILLTGCGQRSSQDLTGTWSIQNPLPDLSPADEKLYILPNGRWRTFGTMKSGTVTGNGAYEKRDGKIYLKGEMKSVVVGGPALPARDYQESFMLESDRLVSTSKNGSIWKRD